MVKNFTRDGLNNRFTDSCNWTLCITAEIHILRFAKMLVTRKSKKPFTRACLWRRK